MSSITNANQKATVRKDHFNMFRLMRREGDLFAVKITYRLLKAKSIPENRTAQVRVLANKNTLLLKLTVC